MSERHPTTLLPRRQERTQRHVATEERLSAIEGRQTQIVELLTGVVTNHVLDSETVQVPADGVLERSWKIPIGSIAVNNTTDQALTVVTGTRSSDTAPPVGKGLVVIPAGKSVVVPLTGRAVTFYGHAGQRFYFAVFTMLVPPSFGS